MAEAITEEKLRAAKFALALHVILGGGMIYLYQCLDYPRLTVKRTRERSGMPIVRTLYVDDRECATLAEAAAVLNEGPSAARTG